MLDLVCTNRSGGGAAVPCGQRAESGDWEVREPYLLVESRVMALIELSLAHVRLTPPIERSARESPARHLLDIWG